MVADRYYRVEREVPTLRHMDMRRLLTALVLTGLTGCGGAEVTSEYGLFYTVGPDAYDDAQALRELQPCLDVDGVDNTGGADSLPPQRSIDFAGSLENQRRLEDCLRGLPGSRITGLTTGLDPTPQPS